MERRPARRRGAARHVQREVLLAGTAGYELGVAEHDGARVARLLTPAAVEDPDTADASAWGTASDLVLAYYGRIPLDSLKLDGDRRIFDQLIAWDPSA